MMTVFLSSVMSRYTWTLVMVLVVLVGATGAATAHQGSGTAAQGDSPPVELPEPVPEFVTDLLGAISDFVTGVIDALDDVVQTVTPGISDVPSAQTPADR